MENRHDMTAEKQSLKDKLMAIILLETSKDYKEMDSDLVTECVDFLMELEGKQKLTKAEIEQRVNEIPFKGKVTAINSYAKKKIRAKRLAVVAAILAVIVALFGIISVASEDVFGNLLFQVGSEVWKLFEDGKMELDGVTVYKPDEQKNYSSAEEFIKNEDLDILCPKWLPEGEKIVNVLCEVYGEAEIYTFQCSNPLHSIEVKLNADLAEELKENNIKKEIGNLTVYIKNTDQNIQADFEYKNNCYTVCSDTEENLIKVIENLKEIN